MTPGSRCVEALPGSFDDVSDYSRPLTSCVPMSCSAEGRVLIEGSPCNPGTCPPPPPSHPWLTRAPYHGTVANTLECTVNSPKQVLARPVLLSCTLTLSRARVMVCA